jgi:hypothetical protein
VPDLREQHPEDPIGAGKSRSWMSLLEYSDLLPQREVLEREIATALNERSQRSGNDS